MKGNKLDNIPSEPSMASFLAFSVHDMKNSVSILIDGLEKTLASVDSVSFPAYDGLVQMNHEAKRINNNLVQLLTLYKLGQQIYPFDPQSVSLNDLLQTIAAQNIELLKSRGIKLEIHVETDLYWHLDEDLVSGVVGNALNNAIRYTQDCIYLIAKENKGVLELRLEDNGEGYPDSVLQENIDNMRSVDFQNGNTGLGFYFSAIVARLHKNHDRLGEIKLENGGHLGGACFMLHLP
tara:strand:- start:210 stop:917 length:708 start_codon:yes stop_codon:yes gene_type:complete